MSNQFGDLEITDPTAMRVLAHPVRLSILDRLRRDGPATASQLAPHVGATPSVTSWHLRHLARFGLVRDSEPTGDRRQRCWEAVARGFRFDFPEDESDEEGVAAARVLSHQHFLRYADLPIQWLKDAEPELEHRWRRRAGLSNTRLMVSDDELATIEQEIERVLAPYVTRDEAERPEDSRGVRLLRYVLPEPPDSTGSERPAPDQTVSESERESGGNVGGTE